MKTLAACVAVLLAALAIASPAGAASRLERQSAAFAVTSPAAPRDLVIYGPAGSAVSARASGSLARYPVDGAGRSVDITQSTLCLTFCGDTPEEIAALLGSFLHGDEVNLLSVFMVKPAEMSSPTACGSANALACYYPGENLMVISGDDFTDPADNATQEFVIAHEYGHHLANHRDNSPFDNPAIDWGPKNWAGFARVCEGVRSARYFPGAQGDSRYYLNPGEAFAESFAHVTFPGNPVPWHWSAFIPPTSGAAAPIQRDALDPWTGPANEMKRGKFPKRRRPRKKIKVFETPRDGDLTLTLSGPDRADLGLRLWSPDGRLIDESDAFGSREQVSYRLCGERRVIAVVRRHGRRLTPFKLTGLIP